MLITVLVFTAIIFFTKIGNAQINRPVGINLTQIEDWSEEFVFVDIMNQSREWMPHGIAPFSPWSSGVEVPLRSDGYPIEIPYNNGIDPPQGVRTLLYFGELENIYPAGNYRLQVDGFGSIQLWGAASGIFNCPLDTFVSVDNSLGGIGLELLESQVDDPVHNIRMVMPGFENVYQTNPYHPKLIEFLQDFQVIRFMEWMETNDSEVTTWSDRTQPNNYTQTLSSGVAYEHIIALCNLLQKDAWINIPHQADQTYITELARFFRDRLDADLKIYIEYSNEVWNNIFAQNDYAIAQAERLGFPGKPWEKAWIYTAKRSADVFQIFEDEFIDDSRFIKVIPGWAAVPWVTNFVIEHFNNPQYNPTQISADAVAIAPYFGGALGDDISDQGLANSITVEQLIDSLELRLNKAYRFMSETKTIAENNNLALIAYEGGQHVVANHPNNNNALFVEKLKEVNLHPQMEDFYCDYFNHWYNTVEGGLFTHFSSHGGYNKYGSWGLKETYDDDQAPKYRALQKCIFNENSMPPLPGDSLDIDSGGIKRYEAENANLIGISLGSSVAGFSGTGHTTANTFENFGDKIIFNINVSSAGDYPLVIRYKNIGNGEKYQNIFINDGKNQFTHFPGNPSWTDLNFGNISLNSGNNTLEISKSWGWMHIDYIEIGGGSTNPDTDLVTPNPTAETVELWEYLKSVPAQGKILSGVWTQKDGRQDIFTHSGKYAAILGYDLWCWHPYDSDVCGRIQQNEVINAAISHANEGGIVQINWHWGNPLAPSFNMQNAWVRTGGELTNAQWNNLVTPGTWEYNTIIADIDRHANDVLKQIKYNSGKRIPILFRPLHEIDGGWFWWTNKNDPGKTVALWNIIFDRLTNHHNLNNLIWVWNSSEVAKSSQVSGKFYPGDDKADILATDIYTIDYQNSGIRDETWSGGVDLTYKDFYDILQEISPNKPKALGECDALPNPDKIKNGQTNFDVPWMYALAWWTPLDGSRASCNTSPCNPSWWIDYTYNHNLYVTLDELPRFSNKGALPKDNNPFQLSNYPNPFNQQTTIEFTLTDDSPVSLYISDVTGKQVKELLLNEVRQAGRNMFTFDASDYPAGMYYYSIRTPKHTHTQKMLFVR